MSLVGLSIEKLLLKLQIAPRPKCGDRFSSQAVQSGVKLVQRHELMLPSRDATLAFFEPMTGYALGEYFLKNGMRMSCFAAFALESAVLRGEADPALVDMCPS